MRLPFAPRRVRSLVLGAAVLAALAAGLFVVGSRSAERRIASRIVGEAAARGLVATVERVDVGLLPPLSITGLRLEKPGSWSLTAQTVRVTLRVWGRGIAGRTRIALGPIAVSAPAGLSLDAAPSRWKVEGTAEGGLAAELEDPDGNLTLKWHATLGSTRVEMLATEAPLGRMFAVRRGTPLCDLGVVGGSLQATVAPDSLAVVGDLRSRGFRAATLAGRDGDAGEPGLGPPTDVGLRFDGSWRRAEARLALPRWRLEAAGLTAKGSLLVENALLDPRLEGTLEVERADFTRLLASAGLESPDAFGSRIRTSTGPGDLGSASLSARFMGRIADPASFVVSQRLDFTPPERPIPAIERLQGGFVHQAANARGGRRTIDVSPASPDFIAFSDIPPLFVRTLLLGEDSGFYGHSGLDLSELPAAILTNWARGGAARGASTISQQLAKNLFLSREKQMGRKLQELSLALLLEARLRKERILEIYLNVIEWGPDLYGLRPAARLYFDKDPRDLTPSQMALLVALIPGPVKYQRSLASGHPSRGFRPLVEGLLAKLRSVDALSEEEYQAALADPLPVRTDPKAPVVGPAVAGPDATMPADAPPP
ncbi:MAG TPA: biosynthetic peptidoglycan transglycosylase [Vicinamibacteria bacterium]